MPAAGDERIISIGVQAAGAIRSLSTMATKLDEMNTLVGMSDKELRGTERTLATFSARLTSSAKVVFQLQAEEKRLTTALAAANTELRNQAAVLASASGRMAGARAAIGGYRTELSLANKQIASQTAEINKLTAALDRQATAGARASASGTGRVTSGGGVQGAPRSLESMRNTVNAASYSLGLFGTTLLALEAIPVAFAIKFDKEFANVRRTVNDVTDQTKLDLISLSEQIPVSFKDLTAIATLGGQLGLGADKIVDFTKVVAELTATTDLSADVAGTLIGRFAQFYNLPSDQFENLASAILKVGVSTVATESQIAIISTRLSGAGVVLHLSAQEVVGFSAALASAAVRTYAAAGTFNRFTGVIRGAVTNGGAELKLLAHIAGVSASDFTNAFNSGKFDSTFTKLIKGMTDVSKTGGDVGDVLRKLGLTGVTDLQTFRQLGALGPVEIQKIFDISNKAYAANSALSTQYGIIVETNASKIKIFGNAVEAYFNAIGQVGANTLGSIAPVLTDLSTRLTDLANDPVAGAILGITGLGAAFVGLLAILTAVGLRGYGGVLALTGALRTFRVEAGVTGGALGALQTELAATGAAGTLMGRGVGIASVALNGLISGLLKFALPVTFVASLATLIGDLSIVTSQAVPSMNALAKSLDKVKGSASATKAVNDLFGGDNNYQNNAARSILQVKALGGAWSKLADVYGDITNNPLFNGAQNLTTLGTANILGDNQAGSTVKQIHELDTELASLVKSGNSAKAHQILDSVLNFANSGGGSQVSFKQLAGEFTQYQAALKASEEATRAAAEANDKLGTSQFNVKKTLTDLIGLGAKSKFIGNFETSYSKAVQPLTDFNSVIGQVQQKTQDLAAAQKAGQSVTDYVASQNRNVAVSLSDVTAQLTTNNAAQQTWLSNLTRLSAQVASDPAFGPGAATQIVSTMLSAGYSVTNASFLQQLVDAAPEQRDAYLKANEDALTLAGQAAADALLATGYLVNQDGSVIGKTTADAIATALGSGLDVQQVMQLLNLKFADNPLVPQVSTTVAKSQFDAFVAGLASTQIPIGLNLHINNLGQTVGSIPLNLRGANGGIMDTHKGAFVPGFAHGAVLNRSILHGPGSGTSDSIIARVANGEAITRARAVRYYGPDMMNDINAMRFPKYANGGIPRGGGGGSYSSGGNVNVNVEMNYPTTRDPIKALKEDAQNVLAGIWN